MSGACSTGCGNPAIARRLCGACYMQAKRVGTLPDPVRRPLRKLTVERGDRFGRGAVLSERTIPGSGGRLVRWASLICDCGTTYETRVTDLFNRDHPTLSCGCLHREAFGESSRARTLTHGMSQNPMYKTWASMMQRCFNPKHRQFKDYGGRGITVCERWLDVRLFIEDIAGLIGARPPKMTLDRADNDGNYEPGNVQWATRSEQRLNARKPSRSR